MSAIVMAFVFAVLLWFSSPLVALIIALGVTCCLYLFVLYKRPIGIICPHCRGYIETNKPWICPNRGCRNDHVDDFPFIFRCEHCNFYPTGYECHHCLKPIFFTQDKQKAGIAKCAFDSAKSEPKKIKRDKHADALAEKRKSIELRQLDVQDKQLAVDLKGLDQALAPEMSVEERYRAELKDENDELVLRAKIDEEFAHDEETRKRRHLTVDKIMREKLR